MMETLRPAAPPLSPRSLPRTIGLALAVVLGLFGAHARDVEAVAVAAGLSVGALLVGWRRGLAGRILLGLLFLDTVAWMVPAAHSNVSHSDPLLATGRSTAVALLGLVGLGSVTVARRWDPPIRLVLAAVVIFIGTVLGVSRVPGLGRDVVASADDVRLSIRTSEFSHDEVVVAAGSAGIAVKNHDLFWHTFTVDELGVDLRLPTGATRRVAFDARPGSYRFRCAIPGHEQAGMKGTLVVK